MKSTNKSYTTKQKGGKTKMEQDQEQEPTEEPEKPKTDPLSGLESLGTDLENRFNEMEQHLNNLFDF